MASYNYKAGLGAVGQYQASGAPYVSGNINCNFNNTDCALQIDFPRVTSWVHISNPGFDQNNPVQTELKVAFSRNGLLGVDGAGAGSNYYSVRREAVVFDLKLTQIFLSGSQDCCIAAGLTGIEISNIDNTSVSPSGSNWSGSVGVLVDGST
tara:strand:- start:3958 stop:4413 length:456 start_codon:yes stop_codon:yes gene_type:complete